MKVLIALILSLISFLVFRTYHAVDVEFPELIRYAMLLIAGFVCLAGLLYMMACQGLNKSIKISGLLGIVTGGLVFFTILEMGTRRLGANETFGERVGYHYRSLYEAKPTFYPLHAVNDTFKHSRNECQYSYSTNDLGLIGGQIRESKSDYRIIAMGDSYTQGVGAPQDSSWPVFLQSHLYVDYKIETEVVNAGVRGSDLFYQYLLLKDKLLVYQPDLVIFMLGSNDLTDHVIRGGMSRFREDSVVRYRDHLPIENYYASSHAFRYVLRLVGVGSELIPVWTKKKRFKKAKEGIAAFTAFLAEELEKRNIEFLFVFHPMMRECKNGEYHHKAGFDHLLRQIETGNKLEMLPILKDIYLAPPLYWPKDTHFNTKGYWLAGRHISDKVASMLHNGTIKYNQP